VKKGFTLVELSIVLVIIGLLIGGILVAQSMIGTSRLQAMTRQIGQFDAALANFHTKFNQLPGDTALFGASPGNNNKVIEHGGGCGFYSGEIAKYWADLSASGVLNAQGLGAFVDTSLSGENLNVNQPTKMPLALAGNKAYFMVYGVSQGKNYYMVTTPSTGASAVAIAATNSYTPAEALTIDQKLDDGLANGGAIFGTDTTPAVPSCTGLVFSAPASGNNCATSAGGNAYNVSDRTLRCSLAIQLGNITGDTK
jgi:prepilin-type N-terminal cleavage/methylation domain-containing protein